MNTIAIENSAGRPVYVYDWDMSLSPAVKIEPLSGGDPLNAGGTVKLQMQPAASPAVAGRRIFFSDKRLTQSLEAAKPVMPDSYTPWCDGGVMFSFSEYLYEPADDRYTFDLSYIDEFSYPITVTFSGAASSAFVAGFEYGFKSISSVESALQSQATAYPWPDLIWPKDNPTSPTPANWPDGIYRIIGPNKVWTSDSFGMSGYAPTPYQTFAQTLPFNGKQLFNTETNFDGWRYSTTLPADTGYVKALRSAATPDQNGKYGFFTYCKDNINGEFTWLPLGALCSLKIYPFDT